MDIIFLGTSSGVPTKTRNVSAAAIKMDTHKAWCLVDCGEGTQQQLLHTSLSLNNLQLICITHMHGDHCYGLPGLVATTSMGNRTEPLTIIGPAAVKTWLEQTIELTEMRLTYPLRFISVEEMSVPFEMDDFVVNRVALSHRIASFAYVFSEHNIKPKLDVAKLKAAGVPAGPQWGAIQRGEMVTLETGDILQSSDFLLDARKPRRVIIAGDNDTPELLTQVAQGIDVLVHESTYTEDIAIKVGSTPQHSYAKQVAKFAEQQQVKHLILTHFSARYQDEGRSGLASVNDIAIEAKGFYSGQLFLAQDFAHYHLGIDGVLAQKMPESE